MKWSEFNNVLEIFSKNIITATHLFFHVSNLNHHSPGTSSELFIASGSGAKFNYSSLKKLKK